MRIKQKKGRGGNTPAFLFMWHFLSFDAYSCGKFPIQTPYNFDLDMKSFPT
jgi:hypothetical protein